MYFHLFDGQKADDLNLAKGASFSHSIIDTQIFQ